MTDSVEVDIQRTIPQTCAFDSSIINLSIFP